MLRCSSVSISKQWIESASGSAKVNKGRNPIGNAAQWHNGTMTLLSVCSMPAHETPILLVTAPPLRKSRPYKSRPTSTRSHTPLTTSAPTSDASPLYSQFSVLNRLAPSGNGMFLPTREIHTENYALNPILELLRCVVLRPCYGIGCYWRCVDVVNKATAYGIDFPLFFGESCFDTDTMLCKTVRGSADHKMINPRSPSPWSDPLFQSVRCS